MKIKLFTFLSFFLFVFVAFAQERPQQWCGTSEFGDEMYRGLDGFVKDYYESDNYRGGVNQKWVPVTIHLVADSDGTSGVTEGTALDALCDMNALYAGTDAKLHFYLADFNYIENDYLNSAANGNVFNAAVNFTSYKVANTLNVFFLGNTPTSVVCGVYFPSQDLHLVSSGCISAATWGHEMGHHLSLNHTFYGWETTIYNCDTQAPASVNYNSQNYAVERLDMFNCGIAGDRICDTRPDYISDRWNCNAQSESPCGHIDPTGSAFNADGTNVLSYADDDCVDTFSPDQIAAMHYNIDIERPNLPISSVDTNSIAEVTLNSPASGALVGTGGSVTLEWEATGATHYILQVSTIQNFNVTSLMVANEILMTNTYTLTGLAADDDFFWRVKPFTTGYTCANFSPNNTKFTTSVDPNVAVETIVSVQNLAAYPNPLNAGESLNIELNSANAFDAQVSLYNVNGQVAIESLARTFEAGDNLMSLNTEKLNTGVYVLFIQSDEGVLSRKVLIQ